MINEGINHNLFYCVTGYFQRLLFCCLMFTLKFIASNELETRLIFLVLQDFFCFNITRLWLNRGL